MEYTVRLEQLASRPLVVVKRRAKASELSKVVPDACGLVWSAIRAKKLTGAGRHVALYWDGVINLEVGVEFDGPFVADGDVIPSATPAGEVATTTHFGPYDQIKGANQAIQLWCANQGRQLAGPSWEVYGHWQDDWNRDPSKIRTDVFHLLKT